ncbi:hypothetical protein FOA24_06805 [Bacillus thuringiensis]|uniref:hypothetical protein n=1 Tax=Bacillus thuringiensis TaxID=1428 RepID=UPI003335D275
MHKTLYFPIKFIVLEDYEIKNEHILPTKEAIVQFSNGNYKTFNPFEDEQIMYTEMKKIDLDDKKSILKFVKEFGIPLSDDYTEIMEDHIFNHSIKLTQMMDLLVKTQLVFTSWLILQHSHLLKHPLRHTFVDMLTTETHQQDVNLNRYNTSVLLSLLMPIVKSVSGDNEERTQIEDALKKSTIPTPYSLPTMILESNNTRAKETEALPKEKLAWVTLASLLNELTTGTKRVRYSAGVLREAWRCQNLFEVAAYQLTEAILNNKTLGTCQHCDNWFEVRHKNQKFCPPLPGRKRSTCESTYNQRLRRKRKKETM